MVKSLGTALDRDFRNNSNDNFTEHENEIKAVDDRVSNIVANAGGSNTEIVDARQPATGSPFTTLKARLDANDNQIGIIQKKTVYVEGYSLQGSETDDIPRINRAIAACNDGDKLVFKGSFALSSKLSLGKTIDFDAKNAVFISNHSGTCIEFSHATRTNFGDGEDYKLNVVIGGLKKGTVDLTDASIGFTVVNSYFGEFKINLMDGFTTQLKVRGTTLNGAAKGSAYNAFYLGRLQNHKYGVVCAEDSGGWVTENTFYKPSFGGTTVSGSVHLFFNGNATATNNNNKVYSPSFEGTHETGIKIVKSLSNAIYEPRFEMPNAVNILDIDANSQSNRIISGYGLDTNLSKISDLGRYNRISSAGYSSGGFEYFDGVFYSFVKPGSTWTPLSGKVQTPIGGVPIQNITSASGTLTLDLAQARYFNVTVNAAITSITFTNVPASFAGMDITVKFTQNNAAGYSIAGFSSTWKFGTKSSAPVTRAWGADEYRLCYDGTNFLTLNQYAS